MTSAPLIGQNSRPRSEPPANRLFVPGQARCEHVAHAESLEREADRVASSFLSPNSRVGSVRGVARRGEIQGTTSNGSAPPLHPNVEPLNAGRPLEAPARSSFESRFHRDFSAVRVHDGPRADRLASSVEAMAYTSGNDVVFRQGAYRPETGEGRALLAHELTHVVQQSPGTQPGTIQRAPEGWRAGAQLVAGAAEHAAGAAAKAVGEAWSSAKTKVYEAILSTLREGKSRLFNEIRSYLPQTAGLSRSLLSGLIDACDILLEIPIGLLVTLTGVIAGFAEGIVDLLIGLVKLVFGILKSVDLLLRGLVEFLLLQPEPGQEFFAYLNGIWDAVKNILPGLSALIDNWIKEFVAAPESKRYGMVGEFIGQLLAFIAGFEIAAAKAGNIPKLTAIIPKLEPALAIAGGGTRAAVATAVTIDTGAVVLAGGTAGTGATILASKANQGSGGGQSAQQQPQERPKLKKPESTEPVDVADIPAGFAVEDARIAQEGYTGLPDRFPTVDALTGGVDTTVQEGGKSIKVYRNVQAISIKRKRIWEPQRLGSAIKREINRLADNSTFVGKTRGGVRIESVASKRYEIIFEKGYADLPRETRAALEEMRAYARSKKIQFDYYRVESNGIHEYREWQKLIDKELDSYQ